MKTIRPTPLLSNIRLACILGLSLTASVHAVDRIKQNNADNLNLSTSWDTLPGASDIAVWDSPVLGANTVSLGADLSWAGIKIINPGGAVTINAGNIFTLGASGINMSAATQNLTLNNAVTLGAGQTWNVASGRALTLGGAVAQGGNALTVAGAGTVSITGGLTGSGGLNVESGGTLNYASAGGTSGAFNIGNVGGAFTNTFNMTGGSLNLSSFISANNGASNNTNLSSGSLTTAYLGLNQRGTTNMTVSGDAVVTVNALTMMSGWIGGTTSTTLSLNGGTFVTDALTEVNSSPGNIAVSTCVTTLNFNGGTLKARSAAQAANFVSSTLDNAIVKAGGAKFDTNGFDVTVGKALTHDSGLGGTADGGLGKSGTGTLTLSGANTYTGATIIENGTLSVGNVVVSGGSSGLGNATSAVVLGNATTQGTLNYTGNSATYTRGFSVAAGGGRINAATSGQTLTIGTGNITGNGALTIGGAGNTTVNSSIQNGILSLAKSDAGTLLLAGSNTYGGATAISGGKLYLNNTNATSGITVSSGATLGGTGSASSATAVVASGGLIEAGYNGSGSLGLAGLTFAGAASVNITGISNYGSSAAINTSASNGLTASGAANSVVLKLNGAAPTGSGTAHLLAYSGAIQGAGFSAFTLDSSAMTGLGARALLSLANSVGYVDLNYTIDHPIWKGALDGNWTPTTQAAPKNWVLASNTATATDFLANDAVEFADGAANPVVTISGGDVNPAELNFTSASQAYTLQGTNGITGAAKLYKTGAGSLTINNANNHTGGTTLTAGTLNIGNAGALGSGTLTIGGGKMDNTSGSPITLANNPGAWNGDFVFGGTNDLNLGTGAVTLGANVNVTVQAGTLTTGGAISGASFGLTKSGSGTLALSGANTYGGGTSLNGGTLALGSAGALGNSGTLSFGGGSLQYSASNTTDYSARFSTVAGQAYQVDTNGQSVTWATALSSSGGTLTKAGAGTLTLTASPTYGGATTIDGGTLVLRTPSFNTYGGGQININNGSVLKLEDGGGSHRYDFGTKTFNFGATGGGKISTVGSSMNWVGQGTWTFKTNGGAKNTIDGAAGMNLNGNSIVFDVTRGDDVASDLNIAIPVGNTSGSLTKTGTGIVTLAGINTYTGVTTINAGTLEIGGAGTLGSSGTYAGNITNTGTLLVSTSANQTLSGTISGNGALTKSGTGTLILSNFTNSYNGATTVANGTLLVTGKISGSTTVNGATATLTGTGSLGPVTMTDGTLTSGDPISSIAPIFTGDLHLNGGTALFELDSFGNNDRFDAASLAFGARVNLSLSFNADLQEGTVYTLIDNGDTNPTSLGSGGFALNGSLIAPNTDFQFTSNGFTETFQLSYAGGTGNELTLTVVPEPGAFAAILGGMGVLVARRRRVA